ncbi:MAG: hypothetical protein LQ338_007563 [Usnochroma carphineum]|nr:MAG: hypothetical protein LQ338_007563 [Usnochroma carphineum]
MAGNLSSDASRDTSTVPESHQNLTIRKRRQTGDLDAPLPLRSDDMYTLQCVTERRDYAITRLESKTRYLTPNSEKLLTLYNNACWDFVLEEEVAEWTAEKRKRHIEEIRAYETHISTAGFVKDISSPGLLAELITLRRYVYLARYGDYAAHLVSHLRKEAAIKPRTAFAETISGKQHWSEISNAIREESPVWTEQRAQDVELVPTTYAVYDNCVRAGIRNHDHMIAVIHVYADRNVAFHRGLQENLEAQKYATIAKWLYEDLRDLSSVCSPAMAEAEEVMRVVLEQLRDEWFDVTYAPDQPEGWNHKPAIRAVHDQLKNTKKVKEDTLRAVAEKAAQRLGLDDQNSELLMQAAAEPATPQQLPPPGPGSPTVSGKGEGKASKAKRAVDTSDRRRAWDYIMEQQSGQYSQIKMTLAKQREINRAVSAYRHAYGESPPPDI